MKQKHSLGDLQLAIMNVLWHKDEAAVADVHEALLAERGLAPTTIATMLTKMEKKGVVAHRTVGRKFIYRAVIAEGAVKKTMVADLKDRLFGGNTAALVSHLLSEHEVDELELARLRTFIEEKDRRNAR